MKRIELNFENVGGVAEIYAVPPADFLRLRHDYATDTDSLELRTRDNIVAIPVYGDRSFTFSEEKERDDGGDCWTVTIEGVIPNINKENQSLIETLDRGEWLVLSMDNNGVAHLSGSVDVPMAFSSTRSSGDVYSALNGTEFNFQCKQPAPSVIIDIDALESI